MSFISLGSDYLTLHKIGNRCNTNTAKHNSISVLHWQMGSQAIDTVLIDAICTCTQLNVRFIS